MSNNTKQVKGLSLFFLNLTKGNKDKSIKNKTKINYPPDTEEIINIKEIIVPCEIKNSSPNVNKVINNLFIFCLPCDLILFFYHKFLFPSRF
mgnify:CR=1 FL=1